MKMQSLVNLIVAVALSTATMMCKAQVLGTTGATMAEPGAADVALRISADGDFTWKLDRVSQGQITAAVGIKKVMVSAQHHEITAYDTSGNKVFDLNLDVTADKQNAVHITTKPGQRGVVRAAGAVRAAAGTASAASPISAPRTSARTQPTQPAASEMPPPERTSYPNPYAGNPDMFVRITPQASIHATRSYVGGRKTAKADGYQISVIAIPVSASQTYYDVKLQMVMKGVGSAGSTIELPDFQPGMMPNMYSVVADQLGKEAVICYTARPPSQEAQRWTGTFNIQTGATPYTVAFVPAHEPTLQKASDAPCGGLKAEKATAAPATETAEAPASSGSAVPPAEASLALARGSRLYNAHRYAEARPLLITACEGGTGADACNSVGFMYQFGMGVATDYAKAREYYLKSCNDDSSFSCNNLGTLYRDGLGVPRDPQRALQLFEQGCDAGVLEGCVAAGRMLRDPSGVALNYAHALELFKKACDEDNPQGCGDMGLMYAKGTGVPHDAAYGASLFKRACELGSRNACYSIASMYRAGDGVSRDPAKAREYFTKACDMGDQESCGLAR